jgi:hypothetical protein
VEYKIRTTQVLRSVALRVGLVYHKARVFIPLVGLRVVSA